MKHVFQSIDLQSYNRSFGTSSQYSPRLSSRNKPLLSINTESKTNKNRAQLQSDMPSTISCPHFHQSTPIYPSNSAPSFGSIHPLLSHRTRTIISHNLTSNLPTSQTPNNRPAELDNRIDETSQDTRDAVHDSHDAVTDGAEGGEELCMC